MILIYLYQFLEINHHRLLINLNIFLTHFFLLPYYKRKKRIRKGKSITNHYSIRHFFKTAISALYPSSSFGVSR